MTDKIYYVKSENYEALIIKKIQPGALILTELASRPITSLSLAGLPVPLS